VKATARSALAIASALLLAAPGGHAQAPAAPSGTTASAILHADQPLPAAPFRTDDWPGITEGHPSH